MEVTETIERWKQHFDKNLNSVEAEKQDDIRPNFISTTDVSDVPTFTLSKTKDAIQQLNSNKVAGKDGIITEVIKMYSNVLVICPQRLKIRIEKWQAGM